MMNKAWVLLILFGLLSVGFSQWVHPVDADPFPEPYNYYTAPPNSFGATSGKMVNWSYFKQLFLAHTNWILEYKRFSYSSWTNGNQYLIINKFWNESGFWKINLTFTAPVAVYQARFTFGCDLSVLNYVEHAGQYAYYLNYTVPGTSEVYSCFFNWSDLVNIPGLTFTHGIQDGNFWMRFSKYNIPVGSWTYDPTFGSSGESTSTVIHDSTPLCYMKGVRGLVTGGAGNVDNITVKFSSIASTETYRCALYEYLDNSSDIAGTHLGNTTDVEVLSTDDNKLIVFPFSVKPSVVNNTRYYLVVTPTTQTTSAAVNYIYRATTGQYNGLTKSQSTPLTYTSPLTGESKYASTLWIVASYTVSASWTNRAPVLSVPGPVNNSVAQNRYHMLNITVSDADGNATAVTWYTNASGGWVDYQVNNSFPANTTCHDVNASWCSAYSTKYWWKVVAYDGWASTQAIYCFTTRAAPAGSWSNRAPTFSLADPANGTTGVALYPKTIVKVSDLDGNATTVCFYYSLSDSPYSFIKSQQNNSVTANTTVMDINASYASTNGTWFWWKVTANDGHVNSTVIYHFKTVATTATVIPFYLQCGFDALNIFLFIWILLACAILFGKNMYEWLVASLALLFLSFLGAAALVPVNIYPIFVMATVFVALIGFIKTLNRFMSPREE